MNPNAYVQLSAVEDHHWWHVARRQILRRQLAALHLPEHASILEVGSGTGGNLSMLAEFGAVSGLEMSDQAIALAHQRARGARLLRGLCPQDLPAERFDLVCLFDVLEHIEDDGAALLALRAILAPGGRLVISVPAYGWMWSPHDAHLHHWRRYGRSPMVRQLEAAGLRVTSASYFNTLLFPLALAARAFDKVAGQAKSTGADIPAAPVNALLRWIFALERHLLGRLSLPFGLSLLVVAESSSP